MHLVKNSLSRTGQAQLLKLTPQAAAIKKILAGAFVAMLTFFLAVAPRIVSASKPPASAVNKAPQKQKNSKKPDNSDKLSATLPDPQAIDLLVSQMLAAWQVGDADAMHKYYDDDLAAVSGAWEPPLVGWAAYAAAYEKQHQRTQGSRLDRTNTFTKVMGDTAWVTYQWDFVGQVDGQPSRAVGHTTLVLQKRAGHWLIVLNHTSDVPAGAQPSKPSITTIPQSAHPLTGSKGSGPGGLAAVATRL
jgi:uncharacterized protein (TIGR02246 family)